MSKKSGYLANLKAKLADSQQLEKAQAELQEAQAAAHSATLATEALGERGAHLPWTDEQARAHSRANAASHRLEEATRAVQDLTAERHRLQGLIGAPGALEQVRADMATLICKRNAYQADRSCSDELAARLEKRAAVLEAENEAELQSAAEAMAAGRSGAFPDSLTKRESELRLTRAALATATKKRGALDAALSELAKQIQDAREQIRSSQSTVADIELQELIRAHLDVFARASVAHQEAWGTRRVDQYTVEIPSEALDAARAKLASEFPTE